MILIYPPVAKPGEAPAGISRLSGALAAAGIGHSVIDANLRAQLSLFENHDGTARTAQLSNHVRALRDGSAFREINHYRRITGILNRALSASAPPRVSRLDMAECRHRDLSPLCSASLLKAAAGPEQLPFYDYYCRQLIPAVADLAPDTAGISVNFLSQALCGFALAGLLKKTFPCMRIIMGGGLVTSWMARYDLASLFRGLVDTFVSGPGETFLLEHAGKTVPAAAGAAVPRYGGFPLSDYLSPVRILPFAASDGCWWKKCTFCPENAEDAEYRALRPADVFSQVTRLCRQDGFELVHFLDNALSPALLSRLARERLPADWYGYTRFYDQLLEPDFCLGLKKNGCRMLKLGLESGSQAVLDALEKGIDLVKAAKILRNLSAAGIMTYVYVLFGTPPETQKDALCTLEFVREHADRITCINPAVFNLPAGSRLEGTLETADLPGGDLALYRGFTHPGGLDRAGIRTFLDRVWKRDAAVAGILRRTPTTFTSNHAPFFDYCCEAVHDTTHS